MKDFNEVFTNLPPGWLTEREARLLWKEASGETGYILEVGCYKGRSTYLLSQLGRQVISVDPFKGFDSDDISGEEIYQQWLTNLTDRVVTVQDISNDTWLPGCNARVLLFKGYIEEWTPVNHTVMGIGIGFAYLDGDHTYEGTAYQIRAALRLGATTIGIHDVNDTGEGMEVKKAALDLLGPWDERVERLAVWRGITDAMRKN